MNSWKEIATASDAQILLWAGEQSWALAMGKCAQDTQWHAEGDVWTHTKMVAAKLQQLPEWPELSRDSQLILLFSALFHDAGKPKTTALDENGRTRSPKHAVVGADLARSVLRELICPLLVREEIFWLVRYHGHPAFLLEKENPEKAVISLSWFVRNNLLYLLALADTRGRLTRETSKPEENLHLWRLVAEEQSCFLEPFPFANDKARFQFYRQELSSLHYTPHEDYRCIVTMMSGLPGAGKDSWILSHRGQLPMVSLDIIRGELEIGPEEEQGKVIQEAREQCREHLRARRNFIFNATNITRENRKRWTDLFNDYDARIEIVYIEPPLEMIFRQNRERQDPVPEKVISKLLDRLEVPTITECHRLELVC